MSNFKFTEEHKVEIRRLIGQRGYDGDDPIYDRIEQIVNERDGWIRVEDVNDEGYYYCIFDTVNGDEMQCVVMLQYVSRHCFENPPMDKRLFVYPSGGHEIRTAKYLRPLIPSPPKTNQP